MARGRTSNRSRSRLPKRRLFWARRTNLFTFTETDNANRINLLYDFEQAYGADLFAFTITRMVGTYTWWTNSSPTAATSYNLSVGIRTDEQSDNEGTPDSYQVSHLPVNDPFVDWMYVRNNVSSTVSDTERRQATQIADNKVNLDIRSQRRLDELGQSLYMFAGLNDYPGEDVFFWLDLHVLCKRP